MADRFVIRPDARGFTIVDMWSGEAAEVAMTRQTGLSAPDAAHVAELLNARADTHSPGTLGAQSLRA